ncbi:unannotated protein [freshwater metagenome]|uniref:Unannotated protein n=1 Tax=freshwater metagenome TaxID=449393 RepID=A0A6J7GN39_9ZZZZ|nr:hypothetical protein [Actinomycetota bacterium]
MTQRASHAATAFAVAVLVAVTSLDGVPHAVLQKRLASMGKKQYTITGAIDRLFTGEDASGKASSGIDLWVAASVGIVVFLAFMTALYGAWRVLTGQRDGASMWVSSIGGLVLIVALTGFVL